MSEKKSFSKTKRSTNNDTEKKLEEIAVIPHSLEAEQALLGGLFIRSEAWDDVNDIIQASDFYHYSHRLIFTEMTELMRKNEPIDELTLQEALKKKNLDKDINFAYIIELSKNTPSAANILAYADIIRECAIRRELISVTNKIAEESYQPKGKTVNEVLENAESAIFQIAEKRTKANDGPESIISILEKTLEKMEMSYSSGHSGGVTGVSTGFARLDQKTSGLQPSDLIIIAARPSMGKTTFAMNICENVSLMDVIEQDEYGNEVKKPAKPVLIFSLEMPSEQIAMRMLASISRVDQTSIRTGMVYQDNDATARVGSTIKILQERRNIVIDDSSGLTPMEVRSRARRVYSENDGLSLIMVDYLQLMRAPGFAENRNLEIAEISRSLKALAKELQVPVVALSQLNRGLEQRADKRPMNSDLRESGSIEQDADLIMFIYRDEVYNKESDLAKGVAEIIIGKQRNGPIGKVKLAFKGQFSRFDNLDYDDRDDE